MPKCNNCKQQGLCTELSRIGYTKLCDGYDPLPISNADRIRSMSDAELAEQIVRCVESDFFRLNVMGVRPNNKEEWLDWLRTEAL